MLLSGKKILIGVTGSIAAYKIAELIRLLVKANADVRIIMTNDAKEFITPLTLSTLSKNEVITDFVASQEKGTWNNHVELGLWSDVFLIAPVTANTLGKMVAGISDNVLLAAYLSCRSKVWVAPAMDLDMYSHESTQKNLQTLEFQGVKVLDVGDGELASGLSGKGRLMEPIDIYEKLVDFFIPNSKLKGKNILISAGPTYEKIDPVRFIGNFSSGKMGYALAEKAIVRGAKVTLVSGPSQLSKPGGLAEFISVISSDEMYDVVTKKFTDSEISIMSAAVADFKPKKVTDSKIKKEEGINSIELESTKDILASIGELKTSKQTLIGFALETDNEEANAHKKLQRKNLDLIILNSLNDLGAGFQTDTNKIKILSQNKTKEFELKSKLDVADDILNAIEELL